MKIKRVSICGSLESNDILIELVPIESGTEIQLESVVMIQFGDAIEAVIRGTLQNLDVDGVRVEAHDRGALDCTIRARMETAVARALEEVTP